MQKRVLKLTGVTFEDLNEVSLVVNGKLSRLRCGTGLFNDPTLAKPKSAFTLYIPLVA